VPEPVPALPASEAPLPKFPPAKGPLNQQFLNYYIEGYEKGFIAKPITPGYMENNINQWTIEPNSARGDCFFEAVRDCLNNYNQTHRTHKIEPNVRYLVPGTKLYSVSSLRRIVSDKIMQPEGEDVYDNYVDVATADLAALANSRDPLPEPIRFMVNEDNEILSREQLSIRMSLSATPKDRQDGEPELEDPYSYYWADNFAVSCIESVLRVKIVMISDHSIAGANANGSRVQFRDSNSPHNIIVGTVKNYHPTTSKGIVDVETDNYVTYKVPEAELVQINRYSIYCHEASPNTADVDKFLFIFWSGNHYEALYQDKGRGNRKYVYDTRELPSYIVYMIFENCYKTLTTALARSESEYGSIKSLSKTLQDLYVIYQAKLKDSAAYKSSNKRLINGGQAKLQIGGQPTPAPVNFLQKPWPQRYYASGYDSNLTYYIVIDLELYPGESIPITAKTSLACQIRYEKIRKSYADLFGLVYQPKEMLFSENNNKNYIARKNITKKDIPIKKGGTRRHNSTKKLV